MADEEAEQNGNADKKDAYIMDEDFFRRLNPAFLEQKQKQLARGVLMQREYDSWFGRPQSMADDLKIYLKQKLTIEGCDTWFGVDDNQKRYWEAVKAELIEGDEFWEVAGMRKGGISFGHPFHFMAVVRGDKVIATLPK